MLQIQTQVSHHLHSNIGAQTRLLWSTISDSNIFLSYILQLCIGGGLWREIPTEFILKQGSHSDFSSYETAWFVSWAATEMCMIAECSSSSRAGELIHAFMHFRDTWIFLESLLKTLKFEFENTELLNLNLKTLKFSDMWPHKLNRQHRVLLRIVRCN